MASDDDLRLLRAYFESAGQPSHECVAGVYESLRKEGLEVNLETISGTQLPSELPNNFPNHSVRARILPAVAVILAAVLVAAGALAYRLHSAPKSAPAVAAVLDQLASIAARSTGPHVRDGNVFYTKESGAAVVIGRDFVGLVRSTWQGWSTSGTVDDNVGTSSITPRSEEGAWRRAGSPAPNWLRISPLDGSAVPNYPIAAPYAFSTVASPELNAIVQDDSIFNDSIGGAGTGASLGELLAGFQSPDPEVRSYDLRKLSSLSGVSLVPIARLQAPLGTVRSAIASSRADSAVSIPDGGIAVLLEFAKSEARLVGYEVVVTRSSELEGAFPGLNHLHTGQVLAWVLPSASARVREIGQLPTSAESDALGA